MGRNRGLWERGGREKGLGEGKREEEKTGRGEEGEGTARTEEGRGDCEGKRGGPLSRGGGGEGEEGGLRLVPQRLAINIARLLCIFNCAEGDGVKVEEMESTRERKKYRPDE